MLPRNDKVADSRKFGPDKLLDKSQVQIESHSTNLDFGTSIFLSMLNLG